MVTMSSKPKFIPHRGASGNPVNRFEQIYIQPEDDWNPEESPLPTTKFLKDASQSIVSYNKSPDLPFDATLNPYRGCEHGCIYCYARPTHEYLGFSAGLDFETRIMVKERAPELLHEELSSPRWKPQILSMSGITDCYQPVERRLKLTRKCLAVLANFRNPVYIYTKNSLITRDIDVLKELANHNCISIWISITTLDTYLRKVMEPRTSPPVSKLSTIEALAKAGIPVGVNVAPIIPGLTDHELPKIISAAADAGARFAGQIALRLPWTVAPLFEDWLTRHFPDRKEKILNRVRDMHGGKIYDSDFATRMHGKGIFADQINQMFLVSCRKAKIENGRPKLSIENFRRHDKNQLSLFEQ
jgi:DNA repair photolyase